MTGKVDWGDEAFDEDYIPAPTTTGPDAKGIMRRVEFKVTDSGKKQKITTRMKTVKVEVRVTAAMKARKSLPKFGLAADSTSDENVTYRSIDEINIDAPGKKEQDSAALIDSLKAAFAKKKDRQAGNTFWQQKRQDFGMKESGEGGESSGKYVAPGRREGGAAGSSFRERDDSCTLRVTNLSPDTKDADVQELFRQFGALGRVYLAKDRVTGQSRGFAFVSYHSREDAKRALERLNGYGYDHLILRVEWAQPSKPKEPGTEFRSGYGKALPQDREKK